MSTVASSTVASDQTGITALRPGFFAEYFALPRSVRSLSEIDFGARPTATGAVQSLNTLNSNNAFWTGGPTDRFAARYSADVAVTKAGSYTFFLTSDDGSALFINGSRVILNDGLHGAREMRATVNLTAGEHRVEIRYFEDTGRQSLRLEWQGLDTAGVRSLVTGPAVRQPNLAPDAVADTASTTGGQSVLVNVLANDKDADGDKLSFANIGTAANGTVKVENGQLRYTPTNGFVGQDQFIYTVSDGRGGRDTATVNVTVSAPTAPTPGPETAGKQGLEVSYFALTGNVTKLADINFNGTPAATSTATSLNYMRTNEAFWTGGKTDMFAAHYTGNLNVVKAGTYTFYLTSDDGSALYIDGKLVVNNDGVHGTVERTASVNLTAGAHDIEIRYFEATGRQSLKFEWKGPDSAGVRSLVTGNSLTHATDTTTDTHDGLFAKFFALTGPITSLSQINFDATPTAHGTVGQINSVSTNTAFWGGGPTDLFAARYMGDLNVVNPGKYTFFLTADDGSELYVDGKKVIIDDGISTTTEGKVTLDLTKGAHSIEIRYFEKIGTQTLKFEWQGPDTDGLRKVVNGTALSHDGAIHAGDQGPCADTGGSVCQCNCGTDPDGHDHGGGPIIPLPTTAAEADAYVVKVKALPDAPAHADDPKMAAEHGKLLDLVPRAEATHVAIANGDWFDPKTWYQGKIPGPDAKVLIPQGVTVNYNGESNTSLFTVRVDGELSFATNKNTKMVVDTMVVSGTGKLEIGTADKPIDAGVTTKILIADNGDIDVNWDPTLLSRGIISHGAVEIHGAEKTAFVKVADAPMKGDTVIDLAEVPEGWRVGDTLVVSGTHKTGWTWSSTLGKKIHVPSQDETVKIVKIEGGKVTIDKPLVHDHDTPRSDLFAYVANMSRNITISSENGAATDVHHRGHVMFMHNDDVDVRYAAFDDLGRTDKSVAAFDVGSLSTVTADSNVKGRYSLHFHKTGTDDQDHPAMAVGNTVSGSPGWGFVQHSSNANFIDNVSFDVFGAGFAAEDGDETGIWQGNMAIRSQGIGYGDWNTKIGADVSRHDNGRTGDGFFFAGRLVEAADNVAVNTTHGFVWMSRSAPKQPSTANMDHPETAYGADRLNVNTPPIQGFRNNEAFGTAVGLIVVKANPSQSHDARTIMDGFLNWETSEGANITYTAHYTLKNFDLIGTNNTRSIAEAGTGFIFGTNSFDVVVNGLKVEGFKTGVATGAGFTFPIANQNIDRVIIDATMIDNRVNYSGLDPTKTTIMSSSDLVNGRLSFNMKTPTTLSDIQTLYLEGTKIDSIGAIDRGFGTGRFDPGRQDLDSLKQVLPLMQKSGYYKTADGKKIFLLEDLISDRATGDIKKLNHVYTLDMTDAKLASLKIGYNGIIKLGGKAAIAGNDTASVQADHDVTINVLANDRDPEGGRLRVDGFTDPNHGDVFARNDGTLMYRPNLGFTGTDSFSYWVADDGGNFTKATVTVNVWDL